MPPKVASLQISEATPRDGRGKPPCQRACNSASRCWSAGDERRERNHAAKERLILLKVSLRGGERRRLKRFRLKQRHSAGYCGEGIVAFHCPQLLLQ